MNYAVFRFTLWQFNSYNYLYKGLFGPPAHQKHSYTASSKIAVIRCGWIWWRNYNEFYFIFSFIKSRASSIMVFIVTRQRLELNVRSYQVVYHPHDGVWIEINIESSVRQKFSVFLFIFVSNIQFIKWNNRHIDDWRLNVTMLQL